MPEEWLDITVSGNNSKVLKWTIVSILFVSLVLRWILIFRGGQYFNSDETRYEVSRDAARLLVQGHLDEALRQFTISPEHLGFKVIGTLPAIAEQIIGPSLVMPTLFFSFFSVLNLYIIFLLSRATSKDSTEPLFALLFAASSQALLYYSRHLFPYDTALAFGLLALYFPLVRSPGMETSFLSGSLSFLCFITYNGYWPLAALAILSHILTHDKRGLNVLKKAIAATLGFVIPLVLLIIVMLVTGTNMISAYQLFATSITQGLFAEGWSLPFEYFWHAEYLIFPILGILAILAIVHQPGDQRRYTWLWTGAILFIYICLVIPSVILEYFVVYARLTRQIIPFLVILAAQGLSPLKNRMAYGRLVTQFLMAVVLIQAAWNFTSSYRVSYPREFSLEAQARFPDFEFSSKRLAFGAPVICQHDGYVIQNAKFYVVPPERVPQVEGQLLLSASHPTNFQPYLYEGDTPDTRQAYRTLKLRMNFYRVHEKFMSETNPVWKDVKDCVVRE